MYHQPVLLYQAVDGLNIQPGGMYADLTYGGGGHTQQILKKVGDGNVIAFDQDENALKNRIEDERLTLIHSNFRFLKNFLKFYSELLDLRINFSESNNYENLSDMQHRLKNTVKASFKSWLLEKISELELK